MISRRRGALAGARQGRRERPYQADMGATEDAASRRPAHPCDMAARSEPSPLETLLERFQAPVDAFEDLAMRILVDPGLGEARL